ncbi:MAG: PRD domain-containing protein, partial [Erysipelotrichaceae bacterium]
MESLTLRQKKLIKILSLEEKFSTGKKLADELNISLRTIQTEISNINALYKKDIIISSNLGYRLNKESLSQISFILKEEEDKDIISILKKLILDDKNWQIDELAEDSYISTSTLLLKLKQINPELTENSLKIIRKKNYLCIEGTEYDKRRYINKLIMNEVKPLFMNLENCSAYFVDMDVMFIKTIIINSIKKNNCHIEDCYAVNLYLNITIALYRMKKNYHMEKLEQMHIDTKSIEYSIAEDICNQYAKKHTLNITEEDISYITLLILGQIKFQLSNSSNKTDSLLLQNFRHDINDILLKTFNYYMLNIDYEPFLYNFVMHVDALIKRAKNHQFVNNLIADNIKSSCPFIYDVSVYLAKELEEKYKIEISDEEIGFIAIHIGFVIENSTKENNLIHVTLLCNQYHQTTDHILEKLKENYTGIIEITSIISS